MADQNPKSKALDGEGKSSKSTKREVALGASSDSNTLTDSGKRSRSTKAATSPPDSSPLDAQPKRSKRTKNEASSSAPKSQGTSNKENKDPPASLTKRKKKEEEDAEDLEIGGDYKFDLDDDEGKPNIFTENPNAFLQYYESGQFCDVILVLPDGTQYKSHKLLLAYNSNWFMEYFTKGAPPAPLSDDDNESMSSNSSKSSNAPEATDVETQEAKQATQPSTTSTSDSANGMLVVHLPWPDEGKIIPAVLKWVYTGQVHLTPQNCISFSVTAERYQMHLLQKTCKEYISANLQGENAIDMLNEAIKVGAHSLVKKSIAIIANSFSRIKNQASVAKLNLEVFLRILQHRRLHVTEEYLLYKVCMEYINAHVNELSEEQIFSIMQNVRFRWLTFEQFEEVSKNPLVPRSLLIEAAMARLIGYELPVEEAEKRASNFCTRLQPRPKSSLTFEFNKDDDEFFKGIIGWIATNGGREPWKNPHIAGRVKVHSSSLAKGSRATLVDITPADVWSNDVPSSWFSIDFGPHRRVTPTYYSLRHGGSFKGDSLRTWDLQGSVDGVTWKTLKRHSNDKSLCAALAVCSWPVPGITESYRFFRILQTSHNSSGHNYLCLSGFEFFGTLDSVVC